VTGVEGIRRELDEIALAGDGWPRLLARLAELTGRVTRLVAVHGGLLATSEKSVVAPAASVPASGVPASESVDCGVDPASARIALDTDDIVSIRCTDGMAASAIAIRAGPRRIGLLLLEEPVDDERAAILRHAAVPVAIEAVRRDAEAAARAESASRLIDELRFGSLRDRDEVVRAAHRFGLALDKPHTTAAFAYRGHNRRTWETAIRWIEMPVREQDGVAFTLLAGDSRAELRRIRARLEGIVGDAPVLGALGPTVDDVSETARSFSDAEVVLALLRRLGGTELVYDDLGLPALLLGTPSPRLRAFVARHLGPLLDRDELLCTLATWYELNGSRAAVAEALRIHRNSVGYRMGRIRELLGADPLETRVARRLQAALDARELLVALEDLGRA
jgi:hypothetical protein